MVTKVKITLYRRRSVINKYKNRYNPKLSKFVVSVR